MAHYYKPSGKVAPTSFVYLVLLIGIVFPLLGVGYAFAIWYIPFIYLNFLLTAALGFIVGILCSLVVVRAGKVRSFPVAAVLSAVGALGALYAHWAAWLLIATEEFSFGTMFSLAMNPSLLFTFMGEIYEVGIWTLKGATVSGIMLGIVWLIEAGIVTVIATLMGARAAKDPFCEESGKWFEETELPPFAFIEDTAVLKQALENDAENVLEGRMERASAEQSHSVFTVFGSDKEEFYLSIENKQAKVNSKGKTEFDDTDVVENISIAKPIAAQLLAVARS